MTTADDDLDVQDARDERLLTGAPTGEDPAVVDLVEALRATASAAAPPPSAALAAVLRDGLPPVPAAVDAEATADAQPHRAHLARRPGTLWRRDRRSVRGLGVAAKVALGAGLAVTAFAGAAAAGVGPEAVQAPATRVVDAVRDLFGAGDTPDVTPVSPTTPAPAPAVTGAPEPGDAGHGDGPSAPEPSASPGQGGGGEQQDPGETRSQTGELRSGTAPGPDGQPGRAATPAPSGGAGEPRDGAGTPGGPTPAPTQPGRSGDARG